MFFKYLENIEVSSLQQGSVRVSVHVSKGIHVFYLFQISMSVYNSPVLMEVHASTSRARTSVDVLWAGPATTVK